MSSQVPLYLDLMGFLPARWPGAMAGLGRLETKLLSYDIADITIDKPVFIAGLPRAGSTIIAEILNAHHATCAYQYRDYPFIYTPVFWNNLRRVVPQSTRRIERAHRDGLAVNLQSPEAIDEMLWMHFFPDLHDSSHVSSLDSTTRNPEFEQFYTDTIRKLLMLRKGSRFFTKNNANVARLSYIKTLFPDARFIIPIREPVAQVASLVKQDRLFREIQAGDARSRRYTRRLGHFEFGDDFTPLNLGNPDTVAQIMAYREEGNYARAYALYWALIYTYIADLFAQDLNLAADSLVLHYDRLCADPAASIRELMDFCDLEEDRSVYDWAGRIAPPSYYTPDFDAATRDAIQAMTRSVHERYAS